MGVWCVDVLSEQHAAQFSIHDLVLPVLGSAEDTNALIVDRTQDCACFATGGDGPQVSIDHPI